MKPGAFHHIVNRERTSPFNAVDTFVFGPMILIQPFDILHGADPPHIKNKNNDADQALNDGQKGRVVQAAANQGRNIIRQDHKEPYRQHNGGNGHQRTLQLFSALPTVRGRCSFLLPLFHVLYQGRIIQAFHPQHHGIYKIENTPHKGDPVQHVPVQQPLIVLQFQNNLTVRPSHRHCVLFLIFHHDPFQHRLSADPGIASTSPSRHSLPLQIIRPNNRKG